MTERVQFGDHEEKGHTHVKNIPNGLSIGFFFWGGGAGRGRGVDDILTERELEFLSHHTSLLHIVIILS